MFEPTHEQGYLALEIVQEARRKESKGSFVSTSEDLRLPAQLYTLRKKAGTDPAILNKISQLLSDGKCAEARQAMEAIQRPEAKPSA